VADQAGGRVRRLDERTGRVTGTVDVCATPVHTAAGEGSVWVTCYDDGTVQRIDPVAGRVLATTARVGRGLDGLLVGGGEVWAVGDGDGTVYEIDPATAAIVASLDVGSELRNPALGAGSLWVAGFGSDQVFRITLA